MIKYPFTLFTLGGAGSQSSFSGGTDAAAQRGMERLSAGVSALDAACEATRVLESDGRFNAGSGSAPRADGSVQMDAACMDSEQKFGAVAVVEGFQHPISIARALVDSETKLLAGRGASEFARSLDLEPYRSKRDPATVDGASDTVGCVAFDGKVFAAALSTGGTGGSPAGRVGDVPLIGSGLYAGPYGAVAVTGHGESIAMNLTAFRVYQLMEKGLGPQEIYSQAINWFDRKIDVGLILLTRKGYAGGSNRSMAWSVLKSE